MKTFRASRTPARPATAVFGAAALAALAALPAALAAPATPPAVPAATAAQAAAARASAAAPAGSQDLGEIHFPTSAAPSAQADFERGVLLLHSFEYPDAAAAFREAERREPGFALAFWGEAMAYNHPLWHQQDLAAARAALARLAPTPAARLAKAPTAREKAYLAAVETLYADGDKPARDQRYADAMQRLAAVYPGDLEAASFYALALLGTCEDGRDIPTYMRAAAVVEAVFAKNPRHPGAAHYLIHAYDDPAHAQLGLPAARAYARIAPAAGHALHMPSHIFLALGMWDEVVASNEASWSAAEARRLRLNLPLEERGYHGLFWRHYAELQQGRVADARKLLATMIEDAAATGTLRAREHLALMQAGHRIETRHWQADLGSLPDLGGLDEDVTAAALFAHGLAALRAGDAGAARRDLAAIDQRLGGGAGGTPETPASPQGRGGGAGAATGDSGAPPAALEPAAAGGSAAMGATATAATTAGHASHGGATAAAPSQARRSAGVLRAELAALLSLDAAGRGAAGDAARQEAVAALERAAADEDATSYEFGPPVVVKPAHELAGEVLLDLGRPAEARRHFAQALQRAPRRSLALLGLARAAARDGDAAAAASAYADLRRSWQHADADLPELAEVAAAIERAAR